MRRRADLAIGIALGLAIGVLVVYLLVVEGGRDVPTFSDGAARTAPELSERAPPPPAGQRR